MDFCLVKEIEKTINFDHYTENANKLIRQYVKKGTELNDYTKKQLTEIQHKINERPREKLNFDSPKNIFY